MVRLIFLIFVMGVSNLHAGQVQMSCDFAGFQGIDDIQIKRTANGLRVDIFAAGEFSFYSLPLHAEEIGQEIDLNGFNIFNDLDNPRLMQRDGQWFFTAGGKSQSVSCGMLQAN